MLRSLLYHRAVYWLVDRCGDAGGGEEVEGRRIKLLSPAGSVVGREGANDASFHHAPARKLLNEGRVLCVALDGTGPR